MAFVCEVVVVVAVLWLPQATVWAAPGGGHHPPLSPKPTVVTGFDAGEHRWSPGHRGVDLAAPVGSPVLASAAGVVNFAGVVAGRPVVSVLHPDGVITTYEPVESSLTRGARVVGGQRIGTVTAGHPSCPGQTCLHWGARRGAGRTATYLDPLGLLGAVRVRLKPVEDRRSPAA